MRPIVLDPCISSPRNVRVARDLKSVSYTTVPELCSRAGIPLKVTMASWHKVILHAGTEHLRTPVASCVGVGKVRGSKRTKALRALEILAHGFHDYAARECVCSRGLFAAPARIGRPLVGSEPMTAKERMRRMRAKR